MKKYFRRQFHALKTTPNHYLRKTVGGTFLVGGLFGFLPVVGYWMIPVGLALLAVDFPLARRLYRNLVVWWGRNTQRFWPPARKARAALIAERSRRNEHSPDTRSGP